MVCFYIVEPKRYHIRTCIHKAIDLFKTFFSKKKKPKKKQTKNKTKENPQKNPKHKKAKNKPKNPIK